MLHRHEVADEVVLVTLGVPAHRLRDPGVGQTAVEAVEGVGRRGPSPGLAQMLAAGRLDQLVDSVVGEVADGLDNLVVEKDRLLCIVPDVRDVTRRVIGVVQVLQPLASAQGQQATQAQGERSYS